jgi:hypothetical protein
LPFAVTIVSRAVPDAETVWPTKDWLPLLPRA